MIAPLHRSFSSLKVPLLAGLILAALPLIAAAQEAKGWLLLNFTADDSLLVTDPMEKGKLLQDGWKVNSGMVFVSADEPGAKPLHRMARSGDHATDRMLSADAGEIAACVKDGYSDEGVLGSIAPAQSKPEQVPVYRFRKEKRNLWLIDETDRAWAENNGWKPDGVGFWVLPVGR
jgi:hypothetical protein